MQVIVADARMAVGIAGDTERANATPAKYAAVDSITCVSQLPVFGAVASDDQHMRNTSLAVKLGQEIVERSAGRKMAHGDMRPWLHSSLRKPPRGIYGFRRRSPRHG